MNWRYLQIDNICRYLWTIELEIYPNELQISTIDLQIITIHLQISGNTVYLEISPNELEIIFKSFADISNSIGDIYKYCLFADISN